MIGIDDFALKKRHRYGTVMVDHETRKIISMTDSRDIGLVSQWLKTFPNLTVVTRDGSPMYRMAITMANPDIIQISDRFHLIKGISEAIVSVLRRLLSRIIVVEKIIDSTSKMSLKKRFKLTKADIQAGLSMNIACKKNKISYHTMKKLINLNDYELVDYFTDNKETKKRLLKLEERNLIVKNVKDLYALGKTITEISRETGIDTRTVKKYIHPDFSFTIENTSRESHSSCSPYNEQIVALIKAGKKVKEIYKEISSIGYEGSYSMLRYYVNKISKSEEVTAEVSIKRKHVISLLFTPIIENKAISRDLLMKLYRLHPEVKILLELMYEFKGILLKTRSEKALNSWISKAEKCGYEEINSFVTGVKNDLQAVINSLKYNWSNGLLEASVNKIKDVKKIMHGRCGFELLKIKVQLLESWKQIN